MMKTKSDEITMEEIDVKLFEYRQNLSQIEVLLEREKEKSLEIQSVGGSNISRVNEILKLQKELKNAISFQEELKKFKLQTDPEIFNKSSLDPAIHTGRICTAFYTSENIWGLAMINEINEKEQTAEITWLGYKEKEIVPWAYVKVQEAMKPENMEVGMFCDAIYYEDAKWYPATIEMTSEHGVHVKYKKYNDVEVVSFDSIRVTPEQNLMNMKKKEQDKQKTKNENEDESELEFKLPEYLKITPADNEMQRLSKRKRVKSLKLKHKQKIIEKVSKEKQDNWLSFSQKQNKNKVPGYTPMKKIEKKGE